METSAPRPVKSPRRPGLHKAPAPRGCFVQPVLVEPAAVPPTSPGLRLRGLFGESMGPVGSCQHRGPVGRCQHRGPVGRKC